MAQVESQSRGSMPKKVVGILWFYSTKHKETTKRGRRLSHTVSFWLWSFSDLWWRTSHPSGNPHPPSQSPFPCLWSSLSSFFPHFFPELRFCLRWALLFFFSLAHNLYSLQAYLNLSFILESLNMAFLTSILKDLWTMPWQIYFDLVWLNHRQGRLIWAPSIREGALFLPCSSGLKILSARVIVVGEKDCFSLDRRARSRVLSSRSWSTSQERSKQGRGSPFPLNRVPFWNQGKRGPTSSSKPILAALLFPNLPNRCLLPTLIDPDQFAKGPYFGTKELWFSLGRVTHSLLLSLQAAGFWSTNATRKKWRVRTLGCFFPGGADTRQSSHSQGSREQRPRQSDSSKQWTVNGWRKKRKPCTRTASPRTSLSYLGSSTTFSLGLHSSRQWMKWLLHTKGSTEAVTEKRLSSASSQAPPHLLSEKKDKTTKAPLLTDQPSLPKPKEWMSSVELVSTTRVSIS